MKTAGQWPWKSEPAKECVTTHLPNESAPKMDDAKTGCLYQTVSTLFCNTSAHRVESCGDGSEASKGDLGWSSL